MKITITLIIGLILSGLMNLKGSFYSMVYAQDTVVYDSVEAGLEEEPVYEYEYDYEYEYSEDSLPTEAPDKEVVKRGDTTFISIGGKKIRIIEQNGETDVKIQDKSGEYEEDYDIDGDEDEESSDNWLKDLDHDKKPYKDFKGHWAGFEFGLNNYVDKDFSFNRTDDNEFMDINTARSWNFNLNFAQYSIGFGTNRAGIVTGMGVEWSNYHFNDTNSIQKFDGEITPIAVRDNVTKNRFQTTYLTLPLLLEVQLFGKDRDDRFHLAGGVIGGIRLFSNTKTKYIEDGVKQKDKIKSDYYVSLLRYAFTVRAGYKAIKLYANYYPVSLFLANRGPELYPVAGGFVVSF